MNRKEGEEKNIHNMIWIPKNPVSVETCGGIEPKNKFLFSTSLAIGKHICLNCYWFSLSIAQELKVNLVVGVVLRSQL